MIAAVGIALENANAIPVYDRIDLFPPDGMKFVPSPVPDGTIVQYEKFRVQETASNWDLQGSFSTSTGLFTHVLGDWPAARANPSRSNSIIPWRM